VIIATAGHVDHGKTLLVHALTGIETDRLEEEKDRGLTIDLGFAYIDDELGGRLGFIDVPGHIKFINNMLAGVGAIDYALIVVAADDGPMPQTLEHLAILDQLGIASGAVALTKIDRVDPGRVDEVKSQISKMLENTCLANAAIYPLSSITGEGIEDLKETLCIVASETDSQATAGYFRLAIDRCFSVKGSGLVVTGSVFAGEIRSGDELFLAPRGEAVRIRNIHTQNQPSTHARAGDRCAINLSVHNLKREDISRGNWLTSNPNPHATTRFDLSLKVLASENKGLRHWTPVHVHTAANHVTGRVATLNASTITPGDAGLVQLVIDEPINICFGDKVILRDQGADRTIAGGAVIDPYSPKRGRNKPERIDYLQRLTGLKPQAALHVMLDHARAGLSLTMCSEYLNLKMEEVETELAGDAVEIYGDTIITTINLNLIKQNLMEQFDKWHELNPQTKGLSLNQLSQFLPRK
jgi:selenocysteine-specific elongation factor